MEAQGNVSLGTFLAKQIYGPDVETGLRKDSGAVKYNLTRPERDRRLHRPTYENNLSVLVDLLGSEFQFSPSLVTQPRAIDIDVAHSILDKMSSQAPVEFAAEKQRSYTDEIAFLIRQQGKERALSLLQEQTTLMLEEGFSPEEIASLTGATRERILRKYERPSRMESIVQGVRENDPDVNAAGVSASVGVVPLQQGIRTVPPLSVPFMNRPSTANAGVRDGGGRIAPSGAPSQGNVSNRVPVTTSAMTFNLSESGQRQVDNLSRRLAPPSPARVPRHVEDIASRPVDVGGSPSIPSTMPMTTRESERRYRERMTLGRRKTSKIREERGPEITELASMIQGMRLAPSQESSEGGGAKPKRR